MKTTIPIQSFDRKVLQSVLGISRATLSRFIKQIESEIKEKFPKYQSAKQVIPPEVFYFICEEYGYDKETIFARIRNQFHSNLHDDIQTLRECYGLNGNNCFSSPQSVSK